MTLRRDLTGREAKAWSTSREFRRVVKGQLVCQALDSNHDDVRCEVYAMGNLVWWRVVSDQDDYGEFFDADQNELGAEERELLATLP